MGLQKKESVIDTTTTIQLERKKYTHEQAVNSAKEYFDGDELAATVWVSKYALKDSDGNVYELTPEDMHKRIAKELARIESKFSNPIDEEQFFSLLDKFNFIIPQGSPMAGIGNDMQKISLSNCFVIGANGDSYGGVIRVDERIAQLQKRRCVAADTNVYIKDKGLIKIKDVLSGDFILSFDTTKDVAVFNKVLNTWKTDVQPSDRIQLITENGTILDTSINHPVLIDDNEYAWEKNPNIGSNMKINSFNNILLTINNDDNLNTAAWFAGVHLGDGSADFKIAADNTLTTRLRMTADNENVVIEYAKAIVTLGGNAAKSTLSTRKDYKTKCWSVESKGKNNTNLVCNYLNNKYGNKTYYSEIPLFIKSNISLFPPFLAGLIDSDGHVDIDGRVSITLANKNLIDEVASILSVLGIRYRFRNRIGKRKNESDTYKLTISNMCWSIILPFIKHDKKSKIISDKEFTKEYSIKFNLSESESLDIIKKYKNIIPSEISNNLRACIRWFIKDGSKRAGIGFLRELEKNNIITNSQLLRIISRQQIVSKTQSNSSVYYDLEVNDTNNFFAGNFGMTVIHNCGVGADLSHIRPAGTPVNNAAITATGIVPFMERYSNTTREVAQDGRRGALMLTVSIRHPEAEAFIDAKLDSKKVTGANVSVKIHDDFMKAVVKNEDYKQRWPISGPVTKIEKTINAQKLWNKIITNAHKSAEPGILWWDRIIEESPADCYSKFGFETISTNPCVSFNTWVMTNSGPVKAANLIGIPFIGMANGVLNTSTDEGFFITGQKELFRVTTKKGFTVDATADHPFRKVSNINKTSIESEMTKLSDIVLGDKICLGDNRGASWIGRGNEEIGWLMGSLLGDGTITDNEAILQYWGDDKMQLHESAVHYIKQNVKSRSDLGKISKNGKNFNTLDTVRIKSKHLLDIANDYGICRDKKLNSDFIETTSSNFYTGFIAGWIDADGCVVNDKLKGSYIRIASTILDNLKICQRMLARLGVISTIYENRKPAGVYELPDGKGGYITCECEAYHDIHISKQNLDILYNIISLRSTKQQTFTDILNSDDRGLYRERFVDEIISIVSIGIDTVCDCTVYPDHQFDANGLIVSNCGELPLCAGDSCRLLALNLYSYVVNPFTKDAYFDFELFKEHTTIAQRMMDDIVELELEKIEVIINKIKSDPESDEVKFNELSMWEEIKEKCNNGRRTGTGVTGEGDMLAALNLTYGTPEATKFAEEVHKTLAIAAYKSSCILASERGAFPLYDAELEKDNPFINRLRSADKELDELMTKYGRRNIAILTIAPTGTVSLMTRTTSGVECAFLVGYIRRRKINPNDKNVRIDFTDESGDSWEEYFVFHHHFITWLKVNGYDVDTVAKMKKEELDEIIKKSPYHKALSNDVNWVEKVRMQGKIQKWIDHSISVTVNLPNDATVQLVNDVYIESWRSGCKGCTIYRDGSRSGVLIEKKDKKEEDEKLIYKENHAPKRPKLLDCDVVRFTNRGEKWIGFVGILEGRPYEIFSGPAVMDLPTNIESGKTKKSKTEEGSKYDFIYFDKEGVEHSINDLNKTFNKEYWNYAKLISGVLRHGMPLPYVVELISSLNLDDEVLTTWKGGVARMIKKYIPDGIQSDKACKECGSKSLVYQEGCLSCKNCGSSKCS